MLPSSFRYVLIVVFCLAPSFAASAADWPQFAFDAAHRNASPESLPAKLSVRWSLELPALPPAWPDQTRLNYDACYHPLIVGRRVIVASPADDSVAAYDLATGREGWRFFTGGPVRLAPASDGTRIFAGSDDGWLYALSAERGELLWKFKGAPKTRLALGNGRLIDTWCIRGGPVVADGQVYFAAGIWPFMGVFIHCLDASTGKVVWSNSGEGEELMVQPHGATSFGGIAPQGMLAVSGQYLLVPGGRTLPACYDRRTGKRQHFLLATKTGGHAVTANERFYFCAGTAYQLADGAAAGAVPENPVIDGGKLYGCGGAAVFAAEAGTLGAGAKGAAASLTARTTFPDGYSLIKAGNRLYAGGGDAVAAFDLPLANNKPPAWQVALEGQVGELVAGQGHLIAVTQQGRIYCLSDQPAAAPVPAAPMAASLAPAIVARAEALCRDAGVDAGYALLVGGGDGALAQALAARPALHVLILERDAGKAQRLRTALRGQGLYGPRVAVLVGDLLSTPLPPYFADLVVADDAADLPADPAWCARVFHVLHPYHGTAYLNLAGPQRQTLDKFAGGGTPGKATVRDAVGRVRLLRSGGLPGAGQWTHEHADAGNTRVSPDSLVRAPLGLLWFGGSSHDGILPRHGHGPQPQVLNGRLVIEKVDGLRSMDIYSGRVLWETVIPGLGSYFNNTAHQYGANGTGTNFISAPDAIYVRYLRECLRLDPATGQPQPSLPLPNVPGAGDNTIWGYLNVVQDYLVGGVALPDRSYGPTLWARAAVRRELPAERESGRRTADAPRKAELRFVSRTVEPAAKAATTPIDEVPQALESQTLFVLDRHSGRLLWSAAARGRFRHNGLCAGGGRLYAIDRPAATGGSSSSCRLVCFELATGKVLWSKDQGIFGTWLGYSAKHDVLLESGNGERDTFRDEARGLRAWQGANGRELWSDPAAGGPPLIRGEWVIRGYGACHLLDGRPIQIEDPLTGTPRDWKWTRSYGCNTPAGSEHLLAFRSGAAGFYDLSRCSGTGNWGGFRSSCTNNLIVAGGILTAPDYTRTCTCSYQNQTSLALYPDADADEWTYQGAPVERPQPVHRLGVNFGAPGNRMDERGVLWVEYPRLTDSSAASSQPALRPQIQVAGGSQVDYFRQHSSTVTGPLPWVGASGAVGLQTVRMAVTGPSAQPHRYTVELYFAEPQDLKPGERPFNVALQGREVLSNFDVVREAGGPHRSVVKRFSGLAVVDELVLTLKPCGSRPAILCGIAIVAEDASGPHMAMHDAGGGDRREAAQ